MPVWLVAILLFGLVTLAAEVAFGVYARYRVWRMDRMMSDFARRFTYDPRTHGTTLGRDLPNSAQKLGRKRAAKKS